MADLRKFLFVLVISFIFIPNAGFAQETVNYNYIWERFSDYDANSRARINHQPLTDYLEATVLLVGRSRGFLGNQKPDSYRGSRIKTTKGLGPSRFEGSRLLIHAFSEDYKAFFRAYQEGLERLSYRRPIGDLNQNEQAAYWLNLYNVIVINKLVEEYPVQNLKNLRSTRPGKASFWTEKTATVEGARLSLTDIEKILFNNFNSPLVAFGLWQGSVGGPRLLNYAYTGENVWRALENNAVEFVNSNRGLRPPAGSRLSVSDYYEWTMAAFGTSSDHVLMFIKEYADPNFVQGVSGVSTLNFKIYDWAIADLIGGTQHAGTSNQLGGVLAAGSGGLSGVETLTKINATPGANEGTATSSDVMGDLKRILRLTPTGATEGISQGALDLLMGIKQNSRLPIPIITTEECAPDEDCGLKSPENENGK